MMEHTENLHLSNDNVVSATSDGGDYFFEGVEKLFEIWFKPEQGKPVDGVDGHPATSISKRTLRDIPFEELSAMTDLVNCSIVSKSSNGHFDAYVLSESSMFVFPEHFILKTCGVTTLLQAVPRIIELASKYCDFDGVENVFYSRKNFERPEEQVKELHSCFEVEVRHLDKLFKTAGGEGIIFEQTDKRDSWHLYTLNQKNALAVSSTAFVDVISESETDSGTGFRTDSEIDSENDSELDTESTETGVFVLADAEAATIITNTPVRSDHTLEIIMHELDPVCASRFFMDNDLKNAALLNNGIVLSDRMTKRNTIDKLFNNSIIDGAEFFPCGYSCNGLVEKDGYFTIHVTPENAFSYASFETNASPDKHKELLDKVLDIFKPNRWLITVFATRDEKISTKEKVVESDIANTYTKHGFGSINDDVTFDHIDFSTGVSAEYEAREKHQLHKLYSHNVNFGLFQKKLSLKSTAATGNNAYNLSR